MQIVWIYKECFMTKDYASGRSWERKGKGAWLDYWMREITIGEKSHVDAKEGDIGTNAKNKFILDNV